MADDWDLVVDGRTTDDGEQLGHRVVDEDGGEVDVTCSCSTRPVGLAAKLLSYPWS